MSEDESFISDVQRTPADVGVRLAYAQWLKNRGDPRAEYLTTELALSVSPTDSTLQERLWKAWSSVDPMWRAVFTQPRMLLANPTPYEASWINFPLDDLRPGDCTYQSWPYDSLPEMPVRDFRGEFQWLTATDPGGSPNWDQRDVNARDWVQVQYVGNPDARARLQRIVQYLAQEGFAVPNSFLRCMTSATLAPYLGTCTGCFLMVPIEATVDPTGGGARLRFYADSQGCVFWDLYLDRSGQHCVIGYFPDDEQTSRAWFVAPSFESFACRMWIENRVWYVVNADFGRSQDWPVPPRTGLVDEYMKHYETARAISAVKDIRV